MSFLKNSQRAEVFDGDCLREECPEEASLRLFSRFVMTKWRSRLYEAIFDFSSSNSALSYLTSVAFFERITFDCYLLLVSLSLSTTMNW